MRTTIVLALAVALVVPGFAAAQAVYQQVGTKYGDNRYFGDEDTGGTQYVGTPGTVPYAPATDPSSSYPADTTGIPAALDLTATKILNAKWLSRGYGPSHKSLYVDTTGLLSDFTGRNYMFGVGQFVAWYGTWADLNEDGVLTDADWENARGAVPYVQVGDYRDCTGNLANAPGVHASFGASACGQADEWDPGVTWQDAKIFSYITPARMQDMVNGCCPANPVLGAGPGPREAEPDTSYVAVGTDLANAEEGGKYYAPVANFDFAFNDNSLLETTAVETLVNPALTVDQSRIYNAADGEPTDIDLYQSLDPFVEGLYQNNVRSAIAGAGVDPDDPDSSVSLSGPQNTVVGGVSALVLPQYQVESTGHNHKGGYHFYFDARVEESNYLYTVAVAGQGTNGGVDPTATGNTRGSVARLIVNGFLGAWYDRNQDGFIGDPFADNAPGCTDAWDCGADQDPNSYSLAGSSVSSGVEFVPVCRPKHGGEVLVELTSSSNSWGPAGAYVLTDRVDYLDGSDDRYQNDPRAMFNPFDDIVEDATGGTGVINPNWGDGQAGLALITSGPIELHLVCTDPQGVYSSFEEVLLPGGNRGFDLTMTTETFDMTKVELGIDNAESNQDTDVYPAW